MRRRSAVLVALLAAGCTAEPTLPVRSLEAPIINGVYDYGHPAVVLMTWPTHRCTGTVISPRIVLTAAHCIDGGAGNALAPAQVFFGNDPAQQGTTLRSSLAFFDPAYDPYSIHNDIGLVILDSPSPVPPLEPSWADLRPTAGTILTIVGFGKQSPADDAPIGQKLMVSLPVDMVTSQVLVYSASVCAGDSGGPGLYTIDGEERVVAITSYGDLCQTYGASQRLDIHRPWVEAIIAKHEKVTCERDFACAAGCPDADPDCPCSPDDGHCSRLCEDPESDPDCPRGCGGGGECVSGPQCPNPDPDCGDPCGEEGHCLQDCAVRDPDCASPVAEGGGCDNDFDCAGGTICVGVEHSRSCTRMCDPEHPTCASGSCVPIAVGKAVCETTADGDGGGCAVGGRGGGGLWWALAALLSLARRRRPRSRPASSGR